MEVDVRCRGCGKLLGKVENGIFENKHGRQIIRAERAEVVCPKCGEVTRVKGERLTEFGGGGMLGVR